MEIFLRMLLLFQLFDCSFATQLSVLWRKVSIKEPMMIGQENSFVTNNTRLCIIRCSSQQNMPLATVQDGRCYCFKLNRETPRGNVAVSSLFVKTASQSDCESKGYTVYPDLGVCIKYSGSSKLSWIDAQETCNQDGGYLIQIDSQIKINTVMSHVFEMIAVMHVGTFAYQDGDYYIHARGGKLDPQLWAIGEPTSAIAEFCVAIYKRGLADIPCDSIRPFFCELLL